jgi:hypothetical protein
MPARLRLSGLFDALAQRRRRYSHHFNGFGLLGCVLALGCRAPASTSAPAPADSSAEPSPNARIYPAPLKSGAEVVQRDRASAGTGDAGSGSPPEGLREDEALAADSFKTKDTSLVALEGRFLWFGAPPPPNTPEVDKSAVQKAAEKVALTTTVELSPAGRMRFVLTGSAFCLPPGTELRARSDRYGHVVVWPDGKSYRIVQPGALRAVLNERRADVLPLVAGEEQTQGSVPILGLGTSQTEITSQLGKLVLWQALVPGTEPAAALLCRLLTDLVAVRPSAPVCADNRLPLKAEYTWKNGSRLAWEATTIERSLDRSVQALSVPPAAPWFKGDLLPARASWVLLGRTELAALRTRDAPSRHQDGAAPGDGLLAVNRSESARYLLLDGIPVVWLPPHASQLVSGLRSGRYVATWRDLLGVAQEPPVAVEIPGKVTIGEDVDAGAERP